MPEVNHALLNRLHGWRALDQEVRAALAYGEALKPRLLSARQNSEVDARIKIGLENLLEHVATTERLATDLGVYARCQDTLVPLSALHVDLTALFLSFVIERDRQKSATIEFGIERHTLERRGDYFINLVQHRFNGTWVTASTRLVRT